MAHTVLGFRAPSETHPKKRHSMFAASISCHALPRLRPRLPATRYGEAGHPGPPTPVQMDRSLVRDLAPDEAPQVWSPLFPNSPCAPSRRPQPSRSAEAWSPLFGAPVTPAPAPCLSQQPGEPCGGGWSPLFGGAQAAPDAASALGRLPPPPPEYISSSQAAAQPHTISRHAQLAAAHLMHTVSSDESSSAVRPADPGLLLSLLAAVGSAIFTSVRVNTQLKDSTAWRYWEEFTKSLGTPAMRSAAPDAFEVNVILFACFIFWLATIKMKPKNRNRRLCKPMSVMANVYGVLRVHKYHGVVLTVLPRLRAFVTKLTDDFCMAYGYESLAPKQREPFTNDEVIGMFSTPNGSKIHSRLVSTLDWDSWFGRNLCAAIGISKDGGFRLAEWASDDFDPMKLSRASLFFIIGGVIYRAPSEATLRSMAEGDLAGLLPGPAKNDTWGLAFFNHPLFFRYSDDANSTARALRDLELHCPCQPQHRRASPLLSRNAQFDPLPPSLARAALQTCMQHIPPAVRRHRSWHAFRVRLACLLRICGASDSLILALLRWKSPASLLVYARRNPTELAKWLDATLTVDVASVRGANLPSPMESVPNCLQQSNYDLLFTAQGVAATPAQLDVAHNAIAGLQTDANDFVHSFQISDSLDGVSPQPPDVDDPYDSHDEDVQEQ